MELKEKINYEKIFSEIEINKTALVKAYLYTKILKELTGRNLECIGVLVAKKDNNKGSIDDIILAPHQNAVSHDCEMTVPSVFGCSDEAKKKDYKVIGWWHSHAGFDNFFSPTDNTTIENFYNITKCYNKKTFKTEKENFGEPPYKVVASIRNKGTRFGITSSDRKRRKLVIETKNKIMGVSQFKVEDIYEEVQVGVPYVYGIVVNNKIDYPHTEIRYQDIETKQMQSLSKVRLKIVEDKEKINLEEIVDEVQKKIICNGRYVKDISTPISQERLHEIYAEVLEKVDTFYKKETKKSWLGYLKDMFVRKAET